MYRKLKVNHMIPLVLIILKKLTHPEYNKFVEIMNNPIIKDNAEFLINYSFKHLHPNLFASVIKNKINFYKKYGWS